MKRNGTKTTSDAGLRQRAEEQLRGRRQGQGGLSPSLVQVAKLVHELQVHQIELEMQNEELRRSRADVEAALERYSELYDSAPVGYFTLARDGTIRQVNLTGARLLGIERSRLLDRRFGVFVSDADRPAFNAVLERALESRTKESCEVELEATSEAASQAMQVELTVSASAGGEECRATAVDVTERNRAQEHLRASQRMDAIGRLAGGVAHDFNNMLTVILNGAEIALRAVAGAEALHPELLDVKGAAERAAALTRQLLAFSRQQVLQPEIIDVNQLARGLSNLLGSLLGERVELVLVLAADLWRVEVDPGQLEQAIVNLAVNARDAMPDGGKLTFSTSNVNLDGERARRSELKPGPFVLMAMSDTGIGMEKATMAQIFEPFFTTKQRERGTGLGLSTVCGIVKQCGGDVAVHSEPGRGTTFDIFLPRTEVSPKARPNVVANPDADGRGSETILIVEDEEALRRIAKVILALAGYTVLVAASGAEALRMCEQHRGTIHLALTDVVMPQMTGVTLAGRLRRAHPETKILYMSGYPEGALGHHGKLDRAVQFIGKPFTCEALIGKVREVLDSPREPVEGER